MGNYEAGRKKDFLVSYNLDMYFFGDRALDTGLSVAGALLFFSALFFWVLLFKAKKYARHEVIVIIQNTILALGASLLLTAIYLFNGWDSLVLIGYGVIPLIITWLAISFFLGAWTFSKERSGKQISLKYLIYGSFWLALGILLFVATYVFLYF